MRTFPMTDGDRALQTLLLDRLVADILEEQVSPVPHNSLVGEESLLQYAADHRFALNDDGTLDHDYEQAAMEALHDRSQWLARSADILGVMAAEIQRF